MKAKAVLQRLSKSLFSHWLVLGVVLVIGLGVFSVSHGGHADVSGIAAIAANVGANTVEKAVGIIAWGLVSLFGRLLIVVIQALLFVSQYNNFIGSPAVTLGWIVMRDMANMFFVFVLLAIAIGTILQQEKYSYRTMLPGFIMAAIMVNFSKVIAGVFIDISQVVMNTFVTAFSTAAGGNFAVLLGIPKFLALTSAADASQINQGTFAVVLALIFTIVALVVVGAITAMLVMRIVGLWFLIVLSPWAYLLALIPRGQPYAKKWWDSFTNLVILGPVIAFFLWLSLAVVAQVNGGITDIKKTSTAGLLGSGHISEKDASGQDLPTDVRAGNTEIGTVQGVIGYLLGIGLLLATLMAATELGSAGGKLAGEMTGKIMGIAKGQKPFPLPQGIRERLDAYKGNREGIRKEKSKKFGESLSAFQDRQMGKIGILPGAEKARERSIKHEEKALSDAVATTRTADKLDGEDVGKLQKILGTGSKTQRIAAAQILADKGKLDMTKINAKDLNEVRGHLKGMEIGRKLDTDIKMKNFGAAFETIYNKGATEKDQEKLLNDIAEEKVNGAAITQDQMRTFIGNDTDDEVGPIDPATGRPTRKKKTLAKLSAKIRDPHKLKQVFDKMEQGVKDELNNTISIKSADDSKLTEDQRFAMMKAGVAGADIVDSDKAIARMRHSTEDRKTVLESFDHIKDGARGKELMEKLHEKPLLLPNTQDFLKMAPAAKSAIEQINAKIVMDFNAANGGAGEFTDERAKRARNLHLTATGSNDIKDANGVATGQKVFNISNPLTATAAFDSLGEALTKLNAEAFRNQDFSSIPPVVEEAFLEKFAENWSPDKLAKLANQDEPEAKALAKKVVQFMQTDLAKYDNQLRAIGRNNSLVQFLKP